MINFLVCGELRGCAGWTITLTRHISLILNPNLYPNIIHNLKPNPNFELAIHHGITNGRLTLFAVLGIDADHASWTKNQEINGVAPASLTNHDVTVWSIRRPILLPSSSVRTLDLAHNVISLKSTAALPICGKKLGLLLKGVALRVVLGLGSRFKYFYD